MEWRWLGVAVLGMFVPVKHRYAWLWDVDLDDAEFDAVLSGSGEVPLEQRRWAVLRLIEYAPYSEIRRLLPRDFFIEQWPALAPRVRSRTRREGMAFLHDRYRQHPLVHG
jgi:hypothetical protein